MEEEFPSIKKGPSGASMTGGLQARYSGSYDLLDSYCPPWTLVTKYAFSDKNYDVEMKEDDTEEEDETDNDSDADFTTLPLDD